MTTQKIDINPSEIFSAGTERELIIVNGVVPASTALVIGEVVQFNDATFAPSKITANTQEVGAICMDAIASSSDTQQARFILAGYIRESKLTYPVGDISHYASGMRAGGLYVDINQ